MPNVTLTANQTKRVIFTLCTSYQNFSNDIDLNTAHDIAVEADYEQYFDGITLALGLVYPIPVEPDPIELP